MQAPGEYERDSEVERASDPTWRELLWVFSFIRRKAVFRRNFWGKLKHPGFMLTSIQKTVFLGPCPCFYRIHFLICKSPSWFCFVFNFSSFVYLNVLQKVMMGPLWSYCIHMTRMDSMKKDHRKRKDGEKNHRNDRRKCPRIAGHEFSE